VLDVLRESLKVAMTPTLHPQRVIFFLGKFPQSFSMGPVNDFIIGSLPIKHNQTNKTTIRRESLLFDKR